MGCGGSGKVAPVSGVVTLDGKPVAQVAVNFQPMASEGNNVPGPAAIGVTDSSGHFEMRLIDGSGNGATVGKNQVRICVNATGDADDPNRVKPTFKIPARYYDEPSEFDVPKGGTSAANFELKSGR